MILKNLLKLQQKNRLHDSITIPRISFPFSFQTSDPILTKIELALVVKLCIHTVIGSNPNVSLSHTHSIGLYFLPFGRPKENGNSVCPQSFSPPPLIKNSNSIRGRGIVVGYGLCCPIPLLSTRLAHPPFLPLPFNFGHRFFVLKIGKCVKQNQCNFYSYSESGYWIVILILIEIK